MRPTELYNITAPNLEARKKLLNLTDRDIRTLRALASWAEKVSPLIGRDYAENVLENEAVKAYFVEQHNWNLDENKRRIAQMKAEYFNSIFVEAKNGGRFGLEYFDNCLKHGKALNRSNYPLKWYIGGQVVMNDLAAKYLRKHFLFRPWLRRRAERAIAAIFLYDLQAYVDAYTIDFVSCMGFDITRIVNRSDAADITDKFSEVKKSMTSLLATLMEASETLSSFSRKLSNGVKSIADQTQEQAASLAQTASAIDDVTRSAQATTENALKANQLTLGGDTAQQASDRNSHGALPNDERRSVVSSMQEINSSSKQIAGITSVIEEIAFQTNLLALNAAVEAARAGEQGRGFGVVAAEVRNLAQRSSEAVKQIKVLIGSNVTKVDQGTGFVQSVANMIAEIADASLAQSKSIREISASVNSMERTTQSNAHETDQLNRMAHELSEQAHRIDELVHQFIVKTADARRAPRQPTAGPETTASRSRAA